MQLLLLLLLSLVLMLAHPCNCRVTDKYFDQDGMRDGVHAPPAINTERASIVLVIVSSTSCEDPSSTGPLRSLLRTVN